jgi:uncharacterized lipoprotein YajG
MKILGLLFAVFLLAGCATNVPASRRQQVEQATDTGPYSYQRTLGGPMVPMR